MALHAAGCRARLPRSTQACSEPQQASRRSARRAPHAPPLPPRGGVPSAPLALSRGGSRGAERALRAFARDEYSEAAGSPGGSQDEAYGAHLGRPERTHATATARAARHRRRGARGRMALTKRVRSSSRAPAVLFSGDAFELEAEIARIKAENEALKATLAEAASARAVRVRIAAGLRPNARTAQLQGCARRRALVCARGAGSAHVRAAAPRSRAREARESRHRAAVRAARRGAAEQRARPLPAMLCSHA
jgi:hypothetical protein